jgi:hypothetical protein
MASSTGQYQIPYFKTVEVNNYTKHKILFRNWCVTPKVWCSTHVTSAGKWEEGGTLQHKIMYVYEGDILDMPYTLYNKA